MNHERQMSRRAWLGAVAGGTALALATRPLSAAAAALATLAAEARDGSSAAKPLAITVYKTPTCGCCAKWVDHMRAHGFAVTVRDLEDLTEIKQSLGVPEALQSCHTGVVGRYAVEGHVPADLVKRLLAERPKIAGLAVPGMPAGSPGMEMGPRKERYDVMAFEANGQTRVYARR